MLGVQRLELCRSCRYKFGKFVMFVNNVLDNMPDNVQTLFPKSYVVFPLQKNPTTSNPVTAILSNAGSIQQLEGGLL